MIELKDFKKLSFDTEEERLKAVADLELFINSAGWQFLKKYIELNIAEAERQILENELSKKVEFSYEDLERQMRLFMIKLRDLPVEEINSLRGGTNEEEDDDPYAKVKK
jgi:hypothetical protein